MIFISSNNIRYPVTKTFTTLHCTSPKCTSLHFTCRHFTSSHLNFTQLHFTTLSFGLTPFKIPTAPFHLEFMYIISYLMPFLFPRRNHSYYESLKLEACFLMSFASLYFTTLQ